MHKLNFSPIHFEQEMTIIYYFLLNPLEITSYDLHDNSSGGYINLPQLQDNLT